MCQSTWHNSNEEDCFPDQHTHSEQQVYSKEQPSEVLLPSEELQFSEELLDDEQLRRFELHLDHSINCQIINSSTIH